MATTFGGIPVVSRRRPIVGNPYPTLRRLTTFMRIARMATAPRRALPILMIVMNPGSVMRGPVGSLRMVRPHSSVVVSQ
jgi:hypothetical protein